MSALNAHISRRGFLGVASIGAASVALSACTTVSASNSYAPVPPAPNVAYGNYVSMYGEVYDEGYVVPAVPIEKIPPQFLRQMVSDPTGERPGTIVVDTSAHFLYLVHGQWTGHALRRRLGQGRL